MAKKKKKSTKRAPKKRVSNEASRSVQIRLNAIAHKLGTTVPDLLESYGDAETVIEKFDSGNLSLLVEDEPVEEEINE
jgi:hypothetical protein